MFKRALKREAGKDALCTARGAQKEILKCTSPESTRLDELSELSDVFEDEKRKNQARTGNFTGKSTLPSTFTEHSASASNLSSSYFLSVTRLLPFPFFHFSRLGIQNPYFVVPSASIPLYRSLRFARLIRNPPECKRAAHLLVRREAKKKN